MNMAAMWAVLTRLEEPKKHDLSILQNIVEKKLIRQEDVRGWQGLGIVFGDVLAAEFDLHWVSYADDVGTSKALRWRKTENYVFPVTMFSKRKQFNEKIDVDVFIKFSFSRVIGLGPIQHLL